MYTLQREIPPVSLLGLTLGAGPLRSHLSAKSDKSW